MTPFADAAAHRQELNGVLGRFPRGIVAICCLGADGEPLGMGASAFVPVSDNPPLVSVCVQSASSTWAKLRPMARFGFSFLAEDQERAVQQLAGKAGDRFIGIAWTADGGGAVFIDGAAAWLECTLDHAIAAADHEIALFRVLRLAARPGIDPLVYHDGRFRRLAALSGS